MLRTLSKIGLGVAEITCLDEIQIQRNLVGKLRDPTLWVAAFDDDQQVLR